MSDATSSRSRVARKAGERVQRALERQGAGADVSVEAAMIAQTVASIYFALFGGIVGLFSKTYYVAATDTDVVVLKLSAGRKPGKIVASVPFAETRVLEFRRWPLSDAFRLELGQLTLRLQSGRVYRSEVDTLLARARS